MHVARFSSGPDPALARLDADVTMQRDDEAIMRRVRTGAPDTPAKPWLLSASKPGAPKERATFVGTRQEGQSNKYILLEPTDAGFRAVPCRDCYAFVHRSAKLAEMKRQMDDDGAQTKAEGGMAARVQKDEMRDKTFDKRNASVKDEHAGDADDDKSDADVSLGDSDARGSGAAGGAKFGPREDIYSDAGSDDAAWVNRGLEDGMGMDDDRGEGLDAGDEGDECSDDEGADGRVGEYEDSDGDGDDDDDDDAAMVAAADAAEPEGARKNATLQQLDDFEEEGGSDAEGREEEWEDDEDEEEGGTDTAGNGGSAAEPAGVKRERPEVDAAGSAKRPRATHRGYDRTDVIEILRSCPTPLTVGELLPHVYATLGMDPGAPQADKEWLLETLKDVSVRVPHEGRDVVMLKTSYE